MNCFRNDKVCTVANFLTQNECKLYYCLKRPTWYTTCFLFVFVIDKSLVGVRIFLVHPKKMWVLVALIAVAGATSPVEDKQCPIYTRELLSFRTLYSNINFLPKDPV